MKYISMRLHLTVKQSEKKYIRIYHLQIDSHVASAQCEMPNIRSMQNKIPDWWVLMRTFVSKLIMQIYTSSLMGPYNEPYFYHVIFIKLFVMIQYNISSLTYMLVIFR